MEIRIRKAELCDVDDCIRLNKLAWGNRWSSKAYLKERILKQELFVAVDQKNRIIGYIAFRKKYWGDNYFIEEIVVDPKNRRKGVGSSLLKSVEKLCASDRVRLFSSTDSENKESVEFHKKNNFSECGFVKNMFIEGKTEIIFSKKEW